MKVNELQERCYHLAVEKGWVERPVQIPEQVALICSEACEALESWRNGESTSWTDSQGKPQGVGSEYADIIIRVCHYATLLQIDLEYELGRKLDYNKTRPYKHGNKLA